MVNHNVLITLNEIPMKYNKHMYVKAEVLLEFHLRLGRGLNSHRHAEPAFLALSGQCVNNSAI